MNIIPTWFGNQPFDKVVSKEFEGTKDYVPK
jgi:hypothetical protein